MCCLFALALLLVVTTKSQQFGHPELLHSFFHIDFEFPGRATYLTNHHYLNVSMNGIKLDSEGGIYCTFPRWKSNCPVTLAKLNPGTGRFVPYPSWEINDVNGVTEVPFRLYSVLGIEIDPQDRMWILDQSTDTGPDGSIKLVVYDMKNKKTLHIRHFTEAEAPTNSAFLNDLVVDPGNNLAYISDSGIRSNPPIGSILIYSATTGEVRRVLAGEVSTNANLTMSFKSNHHTCVTESKPMWTGADGIALSCDFENLYWCPLTSREVYAIPTKVLWDEKDASKLVKSVVHVGNKLSTSDGIAADDSNRLYYSALERTSILWSDESKAANLLNAKTQNAGVMPGLQTLTSGPEMIWQDTLAFHGGYLYFTANNLCDWLGGRLNRTVKNYHIYRVYISGAKSYVNGCKDKSSESALYLGLTIGILVCLVLGCVVVGGCILIVECVHHIKKKKKMQKESTYNAVPEE